MKAGFDFGSKNIHYAVLDKTDLVLSGTCAHNGNISKAYESILCEIGDRCSVHALESFGITGGIELDGIVPLDPVIASVEASPSLFQNFATSPAPWVVLFP